MPPPFLIPLLYLAEKGLVFQKKDSAFFVSIETFGSLEDVTFNLYNFNMNKVYDPNIQVLDIMFDTTPITAYFLGFLWGDGCVYIGKKGSAVNITINETDGKSLFTIFTRFNGMHVYSKPNNDKNFQRRNQTQFFLYNKQLCLFLQKLGYCEKDGNANLILDYLPIPMHSYWFRGLWDADGCFYCAPSKKQKAATITSSYSQDWETIERILISLNITFRKDLIKKNNATLGSHSRLTISKYDSIFKLGNYIYRTYPEDKLGLERKYQKYLEIKNMPSRLNISFGALSQPGGD